MEARLIQICLSLAALLSLGASHRTQNFIVEASTADFAREVAEQAEQFRHDLAEDWLGSALPPWEEPCPIHVTDGAHLGAGGMTSFSFRHRRPFGWTMRIQGSRERILDSVLPHEITHTIFATHFGCPLPRWADEGACTTVESEPERQKQEQLLVRFLTSKPNSRGIAFNQMFAMRDYPRDILPLYAQGHSVVRYLIAQGGRQKFVRYIGEGLETGDWTTATREHYGFESLSALQLTWLAWVGDGSPPLPATDPTRTPADTAIAAVNYEAEEKVRIARGQGPSTGEETLASDDADRDFAEGDSIPIPAGPAEVAGSSWYAQRRDAIRTANARRMNSASGRLDPDSEPTRTDSLGPGSRQMSRSQAPQRPVLTVLDWARERRPVAGLTARSRGSATNGDDGPSQSFRITLRTRR